MACLHAAVSAGADAVYLGLGEFNARRNADNFSMEDLRHACSWAHVRGVSIYVTLNIAILPSEIEAAITFARDAYEAGADAFIVQDIGLASMLAKELPDARLHISTQMNVHNAAGLEASARLGAKRVTLARELSLTEIAYLCEIARDLGMEIETFAHGALCVCYSGQCLMSSLIGGRSANRGLCAQACRLPYELHKEGVQDALPAEGEHLLSPRDLCSVDLLPALVEAGVSSLKIEGRMKSPDYVYAVVSVYRAVLDRVLSGKGPQSATETEQAQLAEAFSRGFTTAYLTGNRGNEIMSYGRPNNRGVFIGRVSAVKDGQAILVPERELHQGDVVEFWTNRGHFAETVSNPATDGKGGVRVEVSQRVSKGDRVFRVRNAQAAFKDSEFEPRVAVNGLVNVQRGRPLNMTFTTLDGAVSGYAEGEIVEASRTKALEEEDVRSHVDRLGQTDFALNQLDVILDEGVGMGFSQLHRVRAEALERLRANLENRYARPALSSSASVCAPRALRRFAGRKTSCEVVAWATNPSCARAAKRAGADEIYVPALAYRRGESLYAGARQEKAEQAGYPKKCVMSLYAVDHDMLDGTREERLQIDPWEYVRPGRKVYADNLAALVRASSMGAIAELGAHVPVTNVRSLELAEQWGASRVWLSPELSLGQIADLAEASPVELGLTIIGAQELMVCEHCLLMSQGPCDQRCDVCQRRFAAHHYVDRKGFTFPLITDALGRSHLYNGVELDIAPSMPDLLDAGIAAVMVDTTLMTAQEAHAAVSRAVRARNLALEGSGGVPKRAGTTSGHLFRGVL